MVHIHDLLFFFSLCVLVVLHLSYLSYISFTFCRSRLSIFHLYIYNYVTVHHTYIHAFLSWTTSTYHIHSYLQSLSSRSSSLQHAPSYLNALSLTRTCITYIITVHRSHTRFPGQFYITVLIHAFLNNCVLQYTSILRFGLVIWVGFVIAIHG